jgi:hypothetical protein
LPAFVQSEQEPPLRRLAVLFALPLAAFPSVASAALITPHEAAPAPVTPHVIATPAPPGPAPEPVVKDPPMPPEQTGAAKNWGTDPDQWQAPSNGATVNTPPETSGQLLARSGDSRPDRPDSGAPECRASCQGDWANWAHDQKEGAYSSYQQLQRELTAVVPPASFALLLDSSTLLDKLSDFADYWGHLDGVEKFSNEYLEEYPFEDFVDKAVDVANWFGGEDSGNAGCRNGGFVQSNDQVEDGASGTVACR